MGFTPDHVLKASDYFRRLSSPDDVAQRLNPVHQVGLRELVHFAFADIQFQPLQKNSEFAGHLGAVLGQAILPVVFGGFYRSSPSDPRSILLAQLLKIRFKSAVHSSTVRSFIT